LAILFGVRCIPSRVDAAAVSGEAVYKEFCASCHDHPEPRVPPRSALRDVYMGTAQLRPFELDGDHLSLVPRWEREDGVKVQGARTFERVQ